ncbi:MAG: methyl-accepting chemotaxis protein [Phycisphaerales bacterium]|nr:methyl-accepting chemotaxis protein [Phycisphaerales bacterium]
MTLSFRSLGLSTKILVSALAVMGVVVAANYAVFIHGFQGDMEEQLVRRAAAFTAVADEAKAHASALIQNKSIDVPSLLAEAETAMGEGKSYRDTRFYQTLPVVVGWTAAGEAAKKEGLDFKIVAFQARNKANEPERSSFRGTMLADLEAKTNAGGPGWLSRIDPGTNTMHYMRAIRLDASCMTCHGDPATQSVKNAAGHQTGKDPLGFKMEGWAVGGTHGAYEVQVPLAAMDAEVATFVKEGLAVSLPIAVAGGVGFMLLLRRLLSRPIAGLVAMIRDVAEGEGDLTKRLDLKRTDEIGQLAGWFDTFMGKLQDIIREVSVSTREVAAASTEIAASSEQMSASVGEVARQAAMASQAAGESGRIATEGGQVVSSTIKGMQRIDEAVSQSAQSVQALGERGRQIGNVVATIREIADQTNLLALNAAIEAARAGEHGRGFAVVADEVRKLAERTTKATEEIGGSIGAIQHETTTAVEKMARGTTEVREGVASATCAEESLGKIVMGAKDVASMIQGISAASEQAGAGVSQAASAAQQLSAKAETLQAMVGRFKVERTEPLETGPTWI